jgi:hypothetical protein
MSKKLKVEDKDYNLDPSLWRLVEVDGYPVAALYFNGREFSLGVEAMEDLTKIISEYIQAEQFFDRFADENDSGCGHDHT